MTITLDVPDAVARRLHEVSQNIESEAREALALDLFRREKITHYELGQMLNLSRSETDAFLMDRGEYAQSPTLAELEEDYQRLSQSRPVKDG